MNIWHIFLRAVNVGGRKVTMAELKLLLADLGYPEAETLLASGNVIIKAEALEAVELSKSLSAHYGFEIPLIVRKHEDLIAYHQSEPFAELSDADDVKRYVAFCGAAIGDRLVNVSAKFDDFKFARIEEKDVFMIAYRNEKGRYGEGLDDLEKWLKGLTVTMRNWNTVEKMIAKANKM